MRSDNAKAGMQQAPAIRCYNLIFHDYFSFLWVVMTYHNAPVMHTEE